jgi:ribosomal protein L16 Arg81 hydroxylase
MDPVQKMWMYSNWLEDQNDDAELAKNHAYLLASFWNPEAVQEIMGGANTHISNDEEFEESSRMVKSESLEMLAALKKEEPIKRRRRKQIIKQD